LIVNEHCFPRLLCQQRWWVMMKYGMGWALRDGCGWGKTMQRGRQGQRGRKGKKRE
jgi:hypothetical protein